jgi:hypothetical protein
MRRDLARIFGEAFGADGGFEAVECAHERHQIGKLLKPHRKRPGVVFAFFKMRGGVFPRPAGDVGALSMALM